MKIDEALRVYSDNTHGGTDEMHTNALRAVVDEVRLAERKLILRYLLDNGCDFDLASEVETGAYDVDQVTP